MVNEIGFGARILTSDPGSEVFFSPLLFPNFIIHNIICKDNNSIYITVVVKSQQLEDENVLSPEPGTF